MLERQKAEDTVKRLFIATDKKDWIEIQRLFTAQVHFDMSSLTGEAPTVLPSTSITDTWKKGLTPVEAVHHQAGNFLTEVTGDGATVFCYGMATHYKNPAFRKKTLVWFVGSYDFHLSKDSGAWRIDSIRFNKKYVE